MPPADPATSPVVPPQAANPGEASYSRIAGVVGATLIAVFFWALGNIILFKAFGEISEIKSLMDAQGLSFLAGASLFLPYAVNQLRAAFQKP